MWFLGLHRFYTQLFSSLLYVEEWQRDYSTKQRATLSVLLPDYEHGRCSSIVLPPARVRTRQINERQTSTTETWCRLNARIRGTTIDSALRVRLTACDAYAPLLKEITWPVVLP